MGDALTWFPRLLEGHSPPLFRDPGAIDRDQHRLQITASPARAELEGEVWRTGQPELYPIRSLLSRVSAEFRPGVCCSELAGETKEFSGARTLQPLGKPFRGRNITAGGIFVSVNTERYRAARSLLRAVRSMQKFRNGGDPVQL